LSARELLWLDAYLGPLAIHARLGMFEELQGRNNALFWFDVSQDLAPTPLQADEEPRGELLLYFTASPVVRFVGEHLEWLRTEVDPDVGRPGDMAEAVLHGSERGLPDGLSPAEQISLLLRLRERWTRPPRRIQTRRPNQYTVQLCVGVRAIWDMRVRGDEAGHIVSCDVINESDRGYGVIDRDGKLSALEPGAAIALRHDPQHPWVICIARWIRSPAMGQVEMGLQVVSHGATPVSIGFRDAKETGLAHALVLPPMAGVRRHHAVLAPAGTCSGRKFTLLYEGPRLYVAEAHLLHLEAQTPCSEIFQYQIDPYSD